MSAETEEKMLEMVDEAYLKILNDIEDEHVDEDGTKQYDYLRESKKERMDDISYTLLIEDATKPNMNEHNLEGDLHKFYF